MIAAAIGLTAAGIGASGFSLFNWLGKKEETKQTEITVNHENLQDKAVKFVSKNKIAIMVSVLGMIFTYLWRSISFTWIGRTTRPLKKRR